jgi:hypothetical protein
MDDVLEAVSRTLGLDRLEAPPAPPAGLRIPPEVVSDFAARLHSRGNGLVLEAMQCFVRTFDKTSNDCSGTVVRDFCQSVYHRMSGMELWLDMTQTHLGDAVCLV